MKASITFLLFVTTFLFINSIYSQSNTYPQTGNVGIGTTTPSASLDVNGNAIIDSSLIVMDSLEVGNKLKVQQDMKIVGESVFVGDGKFKNDLKVLGTTVLDGNTKFYGDVKVKSLENSTITYERLMSIKPNGKIVIAPITLPLDDTFTCLNTLPWSFADGTNTDDDIILCPNFKSVTIGGTFRTNGSSSFGTAVDNDIQVNIQSVNNDAGINLFNVVNQPNKYGFKNIVINELITAYSVTNQTNNLDVLSIKGDGATQILFDKVSVAKPFAIKDITNNEDLFVINSDGSFNMQTDINQPSKRIHITDITSGDDVFRVMNDGHVWATEIDIKLKGNFPDYVFNSDYDLMSLNNLEKFILENHHLPNIPSANIVASEGLNVGEMQVKQMEKIEELTLYLLEMNKKIEELKKENIELKELIETK